MMESISEVPPDEGGLHINEPWTIDIENNNSNVLYIQVEYIKDNTFMLQSDATTMSPQPTSYPDFDQHVSPLDPNMSSVARYSPVYNSESSAAYNNSAVVAQIVPNDQRNTEQSLSETQIDELQQVVSNQYLQMVKEENSLATDNATVEGLQIVPEGEHGDILITDPSTGISYLVERCLSDDSQLLDPLMESELDTELLSLDDNELKVQLPEIKIEPMMVEIDKQKINDIVDQNSNVKTERRSQRQLQNTSCSETEGQLLSCVQQICDKPILSRAQASLPESHLSLTKTFKGEYSVFAKKFIPKRTQFGPIEGVLVEEKKCKNEKVDLSIEINGTLQSLDTTNENIANWMCYVQLADTYAKQNLVLTQQDNNLYYTTTKHIQPKQELLVSYGVSYAQSRNLPVLEPLIDDEDLWPCYECSEKFITSEQFQKHLDDHDIASNQQYRKKKKFLNQSPKNEALQCTVCLEIFSSNKFGILRKHLMDHGLDSQEPLQNRFIIANKNCDYIKHELNTPDMNISSDEQNNVEMDEPSSVSFEAPKQVESSKMEYKCPVCYKVFASGDRIQRHMLVHGTEESKPFQCSKCSKRFLNNSALACHFKTHLLGRKVFECPICKESFTHVLQLKLHVPKHCIDGLYTCPHCTKVFEKYSIIRKHIRAFHCERKHMCPDCTKQFPTLDKLRMHLLKHSDHREFLCADCGKQFKRKDKLKEHSKRMHSEERENAIPRDKVANNSTKRFTPKVQPTDYHRFIYKCHTCLVGFKRRGMLVNHLAKRHPDISPDSVPELNLPILRATKNYYCNYCDKVYKSSSKRKAHILKNHPGSTLPLSNRRIDSSKVGDLPNPTYSQTVGSITTHPQGCQWCHKQYASKAKLLQHQRKKHADMLQPEKLDVEDKINEEDLIRNIVQEQEQYYQLVNIEGGQFSQADLEGDSRFYRLLTTGNNMVPPR